MNNLLFLKKTVPGILVAFFFLLNPLHTNATHMMGAEISWTCKGDSSFTINATLYRDCNGIPMSASNFSLVPVAGGPTCNGNTITASGSLSNGKDITPVSNNSCTRCTNPSCSYPYGVQQWNEVVTVSFPKGSCCKYEIQWQECCRNTAITTGAEGENFYINAVLNRCDTPCDNSPYFTNPPLVTICNNQCYMLNMGAIDKDIDAYGNADSLVYWLVDPLVAEGSPATWNSPYNSKEPLKYSGAFGNPTGGKWDPANNICQGFHLDSITGDLYFKPVKTDVTVIAIQVQSWKKDALGNPYLSSSVTRDVQLSVITCPANHLPTITGINGTSTFDIDYCVDQYKCFKIISYDQDTADTVTLSWNQAIPGATFTANNNVTKHPVGTFCWKAIQARSYPYYFVINARDNAFPSPGQTSQSYTIHVHPRPEANYSATIIGCGEVLFQAKPLIGFNIPGISQYTWSGPGSPPLFSNSDSFVHKYRLSGTYPYSLSIVSNMGCTYTYNDSVVIPKQVEVFLPTEDTTVFAGTKMNIQATTKLGKAPYHYLWNVFPNSDTSSISYTFTKDTVIIVNITDGSGCNNYDSMYVHIVHIRALFSAQDTTCLSNPVYFADNSLATATCGVINKWLWSFGDGSTDTLKSPSHIYSRSGTYGVMLKISSSGGCSDSFYKTIYIDSPCVTKAIAGFSVMGKSPYCEDSLISFFDNSSTKFCGAVNKWLWSFGDGKTDTLENPVHTYKSAGNFNVKLRVSTTQNCTDSFSKSVTINSCTTTALAKPSNIYSGITLYPNPVNSALNIDAGTNTINSITVFDALGREVQVETGIKTSKTSIPTSSLPAGIYFLRLGIGDGYYRTRFMKE